MGCPDIFEQDDWGPSRHIQQVRFHVEGTFNQVDTVLTGEFLRDERLMHYPVILPAAAEVMPLSVTAPYFSAKHIPVSDPLPCLDAWILVHGRGHGRA